MAAQTWPEAVELLRCDAVWPYLLFADERLAPRLRAEGLVARALAAGETTASQVRRDHPGAHPEEILARLGVPIVYSDEESRVPWRYPRSSYQPRPPQVTVFVHAIAALSEAAHATRLDDVFPEDRLREILPAHELYHHVALTASQRVSAQQRLRRHLIGPLGWWIELPVLDEVAAHSFVRAFLDLRVTPAILDLWTIYRSPERLTSLLQLARSLVDDAPAARL